MRAARRTRPEDKVVFVSDYAEDAFVSGDSRISDVSLLPKPFTLTELTRKVTELLEA